jgi:hypothetical protein
VSYALSAVNDASARSFWRSSLVTRVLSWVDKQVQWTRVVRVGQCDPAERARTAAQRRVVGNRDVQLELPNGEVAPLH